MGNTVRPAGGRIRALRIQRGWTQEQLAEIAGVSPRTIQRTEAADRASFETVRAVAAAFGNEFEELLISYAPEKPPTSEECPTPMQVTAPALEELSPGHDRDWSPIWLLVPALSLGVLVGVVVMRHVGTASSPVQEASAARVATAPPVALGGDLLVPPPEAPIPTAGGYADRRRVLRATPGISAPGTDIPRGGKSRATAYAPSLFRTVVGEKPARTMIQENGLPQPRLIPLELREAEWILPALSLAAPSSPADCAQAAPDESVSGTGAVRQAMGQAGRKTGVVFAKFGASMRKAF